MDLQRIGAVLQSVVVFRRCGGQFPGLANRDESCIEAVRQGRAKNEPARLHAEHEIYISPDVVLRKRIYQRCKPDLIFEQRGDVVKQNALLREVRNFANQLLQVLAIDGRL